MRLQRHPEGSEESILRENRDGYRHLQAHGNLRELEVVVVQQSFRGHQHYGQQPSLPRPGTHHLRVSIAVALGSLALAAFPPPGPVPALTVASKIFELNGRPLFVVGVSLFDALGSTAPRDRDLDALKAWGVNLVRVWAHWHEPIYLPDGTLSEAG